MIRDVSRQTGITQVMETVGKRENVVSEGSRALSKGVISQEVLSRFVCGQLKTRHSPSPSPSPSPEKAAPFCLVPPHGVPRSSGQPCGAVRSARSCSVLKQPLAAERLSPYSALVFGILAWFLSLFVAS